MPFCPSQAGCPASGCRDDANPCTTDLCDPVWGCLHIPTDGASCDDGNLCTGPDRCLRASCAGPPLTGACDDDEECTEEDRCADGLCVGTPVEKPCDDDEVCTIDDWCHMDSYCYGVPSPGVPCDDEEICTTGDICGDYQCDGTTLICAADGDTCTFDTCVPGLGCTYPPDPICTPAGN